MDKDLREQIADKLGDLWRLWRSKSHLVHKGEMTLEQYWLLTKLEQYGTQCVSELAKAIGTKPSSATLSVQRLERDGLLKRTRCSDDERVVRVSLTEKGSAMLQSWRNEQHNAISEILLALDASEQQEFLKLLQKILEP